MHRPNAQMFAAIGVIWLAAACGVDATLTPGQPQDLNDVAIPGVPINACAYRSTEPTPAPNLTTPTPTPSSTPTLSDRPPRATSPSVAVTANPGLPPPAVPEPVAAWREAVVRLNIELAGGRSRYQHGLVVSPGVVLTVLDFRQQISALSVEVSGRGTFAAELQRFDPRTGTAMLAIEAEDLVAAPGQHSTVALGKPVLLLSPNEDGGTLVVEKTFAVPSSNGSNDLFALDLGYASRQRLGTVVVSTDGTPIGLVGVDWQWTGVMVFSGPAPGPDQVAVRLGSARRCHKRCLRTPALFLSGSLITARTGADSWTVRQPANW